MRPTSTRRVAVAVILLAGLVPLAPSGSALVMACLDDTLGICEFTNRHILTGRNFSLCAGQGPSASLRACTLVAFGDDLSYAQASFAIVVCLNPPGVNPATCHEEAMSVHVPVTA